MASSQLGPASCPLAGLSLRVAQLEDVPPGLNHPALFVLEAPLGLLVPGCGGGCGELQHCVESDRWLHRAVIVCLDTAHSLGLQKPIRVRNVTETFSQCRHLGSAGERVQGVEAGPGAGGVGHRHRPRPGPA